MKTWTSDELRSVYLKYFKDHGHNVIPSASLIPENDPTVLFTTAGMHPLVPYLLGSAHPAGTRLTDVQKCIRTADIDDVGDFSHLTFFEMLGNWSLGDYFKREAITMSWEFLTSKDYMGLNPDRLAFSVFEGDENAPRDEESYNIWLQMGVKPDKLFFLPADKNWWGPPGVTGPCGPDTEMFLIMDQEPCGPDCSPACECGRYLEIWNNVFMQYNKKEDGTFEPLAAPNVDTGMGLERTLCAINGLKTVYESDLFADIIAKIEALSGRTYGQDEDTTRAMRIIADHMRTATFVLGDERGVTPSNVDQGYILRRLIRRAVRFAMSIGIPEGSTPAIAQVVIDRFAHVYPELRRNEALVLEQLKLEEERFQRTLVQGIREFDKAAKRMGDATLIDGLTAFHLYDTYGFPVEMTAELAAERGLTVDMEGFKARFADHQKLSQAGAEQRFKGGLADASEATARLHTATHLLHAALRTVLGEEVKQKGSNITAERLRFDFSFPRKMTKEEIQAVQDIVNGNIAAALPVVMEEMTVDEAREKGAIGLFESKYGERVKVYSMGEASMEMCGGPHAGNTAELGGFKIQKEESSSAGVRRIKAVVG